MKKILIIIGTFLILAGTALIGFENTKPFDSINKPFPGYKEAKEAWDTLEKLSKEGKIQKDDKGFDLLVAIINSNSGKKEEKPALIEKFPIYGLGGLETAEAIRWPNNNTLLLLNVRDWVKDYKYRIVAKWGMGFIIFGSLLSLICPLFVRKERVENK